MRCSVRPANVEGMTNDIDPRTDHDLLRGATATKVLTAAAELGIADLLADGPQSTGDLAKRIGVHAPSLHRVLRMLSGLGFVTQRQPDEFTLTDLGTTLRTGTPTSIHALMTMLWGPEAWSAWGELLWTVRTGETGWSRAHGMTWIDFYNRRPEASANFNKAMSQHTRAAAPALIEAAQLDRFRTCVDIGGGDGTLLAEMLQAQPTLEGIDFDLESGLGAAAATLTAAGVKDRCRIEAGDFFDAVPGGGDVYLLKQILHDWDDEAVVAILRSCRAAMSPDARLLILERLLPEVTGPDDLPTLLVDLHMLVITGGRERTAEEFRGLLEQADFTTVAVSESLPPFGYHVIEAAPA
ncbi:methyltransferase [Kribbella pittospori]|uniref:Methyltransferase n=2 Tax=Kribbella pittospori TaxID=722689 RepID=A0A4R0KU61_9ACTN|nr:methyltransferase [Kribbella pittospori]